MFIPEPTDNCKFDLFRLRQNVDKIVKFWRNEER